MIAPFKILIASAAFCMASVSVAQTVDTLAKIKSSGVITMGVRETAGVLSYSPAAGQYTGYQIDICKKIINNIETAIEKKVDVHHQLVTAQNQIPLVSNGTVDIVCGVTTNNLTRQESVAFVNTTFLESIRMLVKANSGIESISDLNGKTVVTTVGATTVQLLRKNQRAGNIQFKELYGKDHADCFLMLDTGRADAFILDSSILTGLRARSRNPENFKVVGESLSTEPIAIMIAKGDAAFKKIADDTVVQISRSGELNQLYAKWFMQPTPPANVTMNMPMSEEMKSLIANPNDKPVEEYRKH